MISLLKQILMRILLLCKNQDDPGSYTYKWVTGMIFAVIVVTVVVVAVVIGRVSY